MRLDWNNPPADLCSAVEQIISGVENQEERAALADPAKLHHGFGRVLRNYWKLWQEGTLIVEWFWKTYKIRHADDISGMILAAVAAHLTGDWIDPFGIAKSYHDHWASFGCGPDGKPIKSGN